MVDQRLVSGLSIVEQHISTVGTSLYFTLVDKEVRGITRATIKIEGIRRVNFKSTLMNGKVVNVS
jgi:hypothetical protein